MNREEAVAELRRWLADYKVEEVTGKLKQWQKHRLNIIMLAIEALEKQIPKKPMAIKMPAKWGGHDYRCPVCATRVFEQSYCMSCGQAIQDVNWSKPKGDSYDFAIIDEVIAYDTQNED